MSIQLERCRCVLGAGAVGLAVVCALSACGDSEDASTGASSATGADGSGGAGGTAGTSGNAGASGSAGAGATAGDCPFDDNQRALAEAEVQRAIAQTWWIVTQTHGSGMFASRAFGFPLPFTTAAALSSATLVEACEGTMIFDEYCTPADEAQPSPGNCSQMQCLTSAVLQVTTRIDPLPATVPAEPPPGDIEFEQGQQTVTFTENEDGSISIEWTTEFELTLADGTPLTLSETADALIGEAGPERDAGRITIEGLNSEPLVIDYETAAAEATGEGTTRGEQVLELTHGDIAWVGVCAS